MFLELMRCGLAINNLSIKQRLPSNASIFTDEVPAFNLALDKKHYY